MWPTRGPLGSCWPEMGPMLAPWTLLSGYFYRCYIQSYNSRIVLDTNIIYDPVPATNLLIYIVTPLLIKFLGYSEQLEPDQQLIWKPTHECNLPHAIRVIKTVWFICQIQPKCTSEPCLIPVSVKPIRHVATENTVVNEISTWHVEHNISNVI